MATTDKDRFSHTISAILAVSMRRREFIAALGGATVALPLSTRAQQPALPVIGFLNSESLLTWREEVAAFHRGLAEPVMLRAAMSRLSTAGLKAIMIRCRR